MPRLQLIANRVRCAKCNADADDCIFIVTDEVRFRSSVLRPKDREAAFKRGGRLRLNKTQGLEPSNVLNRICLQCGSIRKTTIPNI